jgi:hypothetical protein
MLICIEKSACGGFEVSSFWRRLHALVEGGFGAEDGFGAEGGFGAKDGFGAEDGGAKNAELHCEINF